METILNWKKGIFKSSYKIYSGENFVGNLKENSWTNSAEGELNEKKYSFKTKGILKQETQIIDSDNNIIGEITYNTWMTKAQIKIQNKVINWKYDNLWSSKWSLSSSEGIEINYSGSSTKGEIESNTGDELILLSGLFVTNYYWQLTFIVIFVLFMMFI